MNFQATFISNIFLLVSRCYLRFFFFWGGGGVELFCIFFSGHFYLKISGQFYLWDFRPPTCWPAQEQRKNASADTSHPYHPHHPPIWWDRFVFVYLFLFLFVFVLVFCLLTTLTILKYGETDLYLCVYFHVFIFVFVFVFCPLTSLTNHHP